MYLEDREGKNNKSTNHNRLYELQIVILSCKLTIPSQNNLLQTLSLFVLHIQQFHLHTENIGGPRWLDGGNVNDPN